MKEEQYLFRRQYIFGPDAVDTLPGWKKEKITNSYTLTAHPDLSITHSKKGKNFIVLIGYILDPDNPQMRDMEIVQMLLAKSIEKNDVFGELDRLGGRFVAILGLDGRVIVCNDASGFRQIFYYRDDNQKIWCSSQPSLLAEVFQLHIDEMYKAEYEKIHLFTNSSEYWFPGTVTPYKSIRHLTPNHYLDLHTGQITRYWPRKPLQKYSYDDSVESSADCISKFITAATNRFDTALTITAGLDSRMILAGSRPVHDEMYYFTHTHGTLYMDGPDISIPKKLLSKLGLNHTVVHHHNKPDPAFDTIYRKSNIMARSVKGVNAYTMYRHFDEIGKEFVVVNGLCGEISRMFYILPSMIRIDGKTLAALTGMNTSPTAINEYQKWLMNTQEVFDYGYNVYDIFYWEQRVGNWAAMSFNEYDIAFESFSPLNSRRLLETMLGVDSRYRREPNYSFHRDIIKRLWPETLQLPINPTSRKKAILNSIKGSGFYQLLKALKFWPYIRFLPSFSNS